MRPCACALAHVCVYQCDVPVGSGGIYSSACDRRAAARACCVWCHRLVACVAAGATWWLVSYAPWAGRFGHTSVIDAAGAIYVIGGDGSTYNTPTIFNDVWVSTDGGADWT